ncbi:PAS domain-containing sensor histidine kinase [Pyxidicoccus fallax]|uniref:histidine kinase n=1 Tax=Pyxidicoccus fallax TaxID=394095 RepID=A0A848LCX9_9BACT|nr:PAS domain-containing sensor histidine kinase [Pyxidicoccus fallax]NMO14665.1 PAS domain-containing protein [Pyxidicoccus fallax]NPC78456.1 PAS domain-containing sensor histidine kinase [Pyxidicoccus fallax]
MAMEPAAPVLEDSLDDEEEAPRSPATSPTLEEALFRLADAARCLARAHQATVTLSSSVAGRRGACTTSLSRSYETWGGYTVPMGPCAVRRPGRESPWPEQGSGAPPAAREGRTSRPKGWLSVPFLGGEGQLHLFDAMSGEDFSPEDEAAIGGLAGLADLALETVRLREENAALRRKVRQGEQRFQALVVATKHVVWMTDGQGGIDRPCPTWENFTGQSREQYSGWGWVSAVHPDDQARVADALRQTYLSRPSQLSRGTYECEYRLRRRDGTYLTTLARAVPIFNEDGTPREWVGINTDLSAGQSTEAELERLLREEQAARTQAEAAEQRAAFLAEASRVLASSSLDPKATLSALAWLAVPALADWCFVDVVDDSGAVQRMSVAHADAADEALAREVRDFPPGPDGCRHPTTCVVRRAESLLVDEVSDAWLRKVAVDDRHYDVMKAVGFHCIMSVPLLARGRALGALTFLAVRPSRRYTQADLTTAQDLARRAALLLDNAILYREARQSVLLRDEFLSIASHELKTPLTPLQLRLQSLRRETQKGLPAIPTPVVASQLEVVQRQVAKLSALVNGLLDVSRISSGRLTLDREPLDLAELARDVVSRFSVTATQAGCAVSLITQDDMRGSWDRLRVDQVLTNLLTNALKYGAGKPVVLRLSGDEAHVRIAVEDSGIGIAPEHLTRIFERFGRAVSERHYGGLGLGLYITRQIVESHGGEVHVHSTPGQGSRFEVVLPR